MPEDPNLKHLPTDQPLPSPGVNWHDPLAYTQGSTPAEQSSRPQASSSPQQIYESFGPSFPERANDEITSPPSRSASEAQFAYTSPHFYNMPPTNYSSPSDYMPPGYYAPYSYAPPGYNTPAPYILIPQTGPLPLGAAIRQLPAQYWRVFSRPKALTFMQEQGKAAWNIIWVQLLFLGLVETLSILGILFLEFYLIQNIMPASSNFTAIPQYFPLVGLVAAIFCIACVPIPFFIGASIYHLVAKAFGGKGSFLPFCYNYALIVIPIAMISTVASLIPCLGSLVALAGSVYQVILLIYMTMGTHRLSGGKASAAVLIPIGVAILGAVALYGVYLFWILSMVSNLPAPH